MINHYTIIITDNEIAKNLNNRFKYINDLNDVSKEAAIVFMLCHVVLGLNDAIREFNESIINICDVFNLEHEIDNESLFNKNTIDAIAVINDSDNIKSLCNELIEELMYVKNDNKLIEYIRPVFLNNIMSV